MAIFAKVSWNFERGEWLGVVFEAESADADPDHEDIVVLDVATGQDMKAVMAECQSIIVNRSWETRQ